MGKSDQADGLTSPHAEASKLLEAALQQMDGIISDVIEKSFID
ncbi:hypothetical protein FOCC_FOCC000077 [Frankliniella occidentalis]|nr:hypothetical protein FOCC_FOCC000077 [Frankliniella occidentalis]